MTTMIWKQSKCPYKEDVLCVHSGTIAKAWMDLEGIMLCEKTERQIP